MFDASKELIKTGVLLGVAIVLVAAATLTTRKVATATAEQSEVGQPLFPELTTDAIKGLQVVDYNKKTGDNDQFEVRYQDGGWIMPGHDNYPADAKEGLAKATSWMLAVRKDAIVSTDKKKFAEFGVVNPMEEKGTEGVGTIFRVFDGSNNVIASAIVGKEVEGKSNVRYLREPTKDVVYRAQIADYTVSTRFKDWIEKDLLELNDIRSKNSFDGANKKTLEKITTTDYKFDLRRLPATVTEKKQLVLGLKGSEFSPEGELQGLAADKEETNQDKVRDLTEGLKNLQIVSVFAKPPGLKPNLRALEGQEIAQQMANLGYYVSRELDVVPTNGELTLETKEGLVYRLMFGKMMLGEADPGGVKTNVKPGDKPADAAKKDDKGKDAAKKDAKDAKGADEKDESKQENRLLLVTVSFNEAKFPPIPDPAEPKPTPTKPGEKAKTPEEVKKELETEKKRLEADVAQKRVDRDKAIEKGKKLAGELTDRYGKWYYLVANDTYKKVHLDRAALVKPKEAKKDDKGATPGAVIPPNLAPPPPSAAAKSAAPNPPKDMAPKKDDKASPKAGEKKASPPPAPPKKAEPVKAAEKTGTPPVSAKAEEKKPTPPPAPPKAGDAPKKDAAPKAGDAPKAPEKKPDAAKK